jgi:hypothetical protein
MEEEASQSGPVRLRFTRLAKPIEYGCSDSNLPLPLAVVTSWSYSRVARFQLVSVL